MRTRMNVITSVPEVSIHVRFVIPSRFSSLFIMHPLSSPSRYILFRFWRISEGEIFIYSTSSDIGAVFLLTLPLFRLLLRVDGITRKGIIFRRYFIWRNWSWIPGIGWLSEGKAFLDIRTRGSWPEEWQNECSKIDFAFGSTGQEIAEKTGKSHVIEGSN